MKQIIPLLLFFIFVVPSRGNGQDIIQKGEQLNLDRCVEIALKKNPSLVAAKNTVNVNESRVGQAKSNYYPQLSWTSGYSRISSVGGSSSSGSLGGVSGTDITTISSITTTSSGAFDQYTSSAALTQNIYDFGRTSSLVKIQNLNVESSRTDLENLTEQVVFAVRQAYYGVVQAKYNRIVAEDTVKQTLQHLEQAKGFYEVGTKPKFDVIKAEVDLSTAKLNLIKADIALKIAVVNLNNVMGIPEAPEYALDENMTSGKYQITFDAALAKAYENRPDLKSALTKRQAAEASVESAMTGYYPSLAGNASYNWLGGRLDQMDHGWTVGAVLSFPIFSGFLTKYQVEEAKANLNVLRANEESLRQAVFLDVQQAYMTLQAAEEAIPTAKLGVGQAQENLDIANGRYSAGVGNPIEVTDAEVALATARTSYIQALYADKVAEASLDKAMGQR